MKKLLITSGCSFSDVKWQSEIHPDWHADWPKWPEILAGKLDMKLVSLGKSGAGNEYIYSSILDIVHDKSINHSDIGLIIPAWSACQRKDYQNLKLHWTNHRVDTHGNVFSWVLRSLRNMLSFQILMERYNLPYKQFQMLSLFKETLKGHHYGNVDEYLADTNKWGNEGVGEGTIPYREQVSIKKGLPSTYEEDMNLINSFLLDFENKINPKNFIGWPITKKLGGYTMSDKVLIHEKNKYEYRISKLDAHPNRVGQERIAEFIHDRLG